MKATHLKLMPQPLNVQGVEETLGTPAFEARYYGIVRLIAEVLDQAVEVGSCYMTIGTSRNVQSLLVTVVDTGGRLYAGATDLEGLSAECLLLSDAP